MHYRRAKTPGATYFFSVVTYNREHLFKHPETYNFSGRRSLMALTFPPAGD